MINLTILKWMLSIELSRANSPLAELRRQRRAIRRRYASWIYAAGWGLIGLGVVLIIFLNFFL